MIDQPLGPNPDSWAEYGVPAGEDQPTRPRLRPYTWAELASLLEPEYLIKHLLDAGCLSLIWGDSGSGKTFFALDLALHVALGRDWRGRKVKQGRVVYIAAEAGGSIRKRIDALKLHYGIDTAPLDVIPVTVNLCEDADPAQIVEQIGATGGAILVVVDTVSRAMSGYDENGPRDMTAFVENCRKIQAATGAHVCGVHHAGKDKSRGSRGHTALWAAVDTAILIEDDAGNHVATVNKQRDAVAGESFAFALSAVTIGQDSDGDPMTSCVVIEAEPTEGKSSKPKITGQARTALKLLSRAIADEGTTTPASNHIPAGQIVVPLSLWRSYCYSGLASDRDNQDTKRRAFNRNAKKLQELGAIGTWDDLVWIAGQAGQAGT